MNTQQKTMKTHRPDFEEYLEILGEKQWSPVFRARLPDSQLITLTEDEQRLIATFEALIVVISDAYEKERRDFEERIALRHQRELRAEECKHDKEIENLRTDNERYKDALRDVWHCAKQALQPGTEVLP